MLFFILAPFCRWRNLLRETEALYIIATQNTTPKPFARRSTFVKKA